MKAGARLACRVVFVIGTVVLAPKGRSEDVSTLQVQPDRPSFTTSAQIVPVGHVQVELGAGVSFSGGGKDLDAGEVRVRVPFAQWGEVRLSVLTYDWHVGGAGDDPAEESVPTRGLAVSQVDFKVRILDSESTDLGFLVGVRPPGGSGSYREGHAQPIAGLGFDRAFSKSVSLTANAGWSYPSTGDGEQFVIWYGGLSVSFTPSDRLSVYGEAFAWSRNEPGGPALQALSSGLTYLLTRRISVDFRVGLGFGRTAPDWLAGIGASILF